MCAVLVKQYIVSFYNVDPNCTKFRVALAFMYFSNKNLKSSHVDMVCWSYGEYTPHVAHEQIFFLSTCYMFYHIKGRVLIPAWGHLCHFRGVPVRLAVLSLTLSPFSFSGPREGCCLSLSITSSAQNTSLVVRK